MAKTTALILNAVDYRGDKNQKSVVDVNPDIDGVVMREFGMQLNSLTTNVLKEAVRVDKIELDEQSATKITPTLTLSPTVVSGVSIQPTSAPYGAAVTINYTGNGKLSMEPSDATTDHGKIVGSTYVHYSTDSTTVTIRAAETDTCESVFATLKVN